MKVQTLLLFVFTSLIFSCKKTDKSPVAKPVIQQITPMTDGQGAPVTIKGEQFGNVSSNVKVLFGNTEASINSVVDTMIKVTVPANAVTGLITVKVNNQQVSSSSNFVILSGQWTKMSDYPGVGCVEPATFVLNGKAYVVGGYDGGSGRTEVYAFDASTNTWTQKASLPVATGDGVRRAVGVASGTKGYIICYTPNNESFSKDVWAYDPAGDSWSKKADFPGTERDFGAGVYVDGKIYFGFGQSNLNQAQLFKDWWQYNPATDVWTQKTDFPGSKRRATIALEIGGTAYVGLGEFYNPGEGNDWWAYNAANDSWTRKADFPGSTPLAYMANFIINNQAYIAGGIYPACWVYDAAGDTWTQKTSNPTKRLAPGGFSINGKGYLVCGSDDSITYSKSLWTFDPQE